MKAISYSKVTYCFVFLDHRECRGTSASALWHPGFFLTRLLAFSQFSKTLSNGMDCRKR